MIQYCIMKIQKMEEAAAKRLKRFCGIKVVDERNGFRLDLVERTV